MRREFIERGPVIQRRPNVLPAMRAAALSGACKGLPA
jgi:hypothetical protein